MPDFKRLAVWKSSHELVLQIYRQTASFPRHELFGLTSQMRRAAVSIPGNIAEGRGRDTDREFARYITMSLGSVSARVLPHSRQGFGLSTFTPKCRWLGIGRTTAAEPALEFAGGV